MENSNEKKENLAPIQIKTNGEVVIIVKDSITSQQTNSLDKPIIDLIKGDVVEDREDGIYFTRKLDFSRNSLAYDGAFQSIKNQNNS